MEFCCPVYWYEDLTLALVAHHVRGVSLLIQLRNYANRYGNEGALGVTFEKMRAGSVGDLTRAGVAAFN